MRLLSSIALPLPTVLCYDFAGLRIGVPFLLTTAVPDQSTYTHFRLLGHADQGAIATQYLSYEARISTMSSPVFGPIALVASNRGFTRWRIAFRAMLESLLNDGEDAYLNLPYSGIRCSMDKVEPILDSVTEARLVILGLGEHRTVMVESDREVDVPPSSGPLDFKRSLWGDPDLLLHFDAGETSGNNKSHKWLL
ncbi:hypothetical protein MMC10_003068 [Thelotrema lepadinum]|nr:hypothetical protein [Thelotrema lepadinum]